MNSIYCMSSIWGFSVHRSLTAACGEALALWLCTLQLGECLTYVTIAVMKHHDQKQSGEERVYLTYTPTLLSIIKGIQDKFRTIQEGFWTQELTERL